MRAARIAAVLLCLVVVLVVCNAVYVRTTVADMRDLADALPEAPDAETAAAVGRLIGRLDREKTLLGLSVSFPLIDRVRELAVSLQAYAADGGDTADYLAARGMLCGALDDLDRLEYLRLRKPPPR